MARRVESDTARLIVLLSTHPNMRVVAGTQGSCAIEPRPEGHTPLVDADTLKQLCARGLLIATEPGRFAPSDAARAWLKRHSGLDHAFHAQHGEVAPIRAAGDDDRQVLVDLDESPVASLARRPGKDGQPWLSADLVTAAERLRRDFEIGELQPRVTANWSASVANGRRTGDGSGLKDLTDMALAARLRVERAMREVGPDLAGILLDVCCFLKGLETVERERQWPARSAKLVLKIALTSLARHYGLAPVATGRDSGKLRHWGAEDFRPTIS